MGDPLLVGSRGARGPPGSPKSGPVEDSSNTKKNGGSGHGFDALTSSHL